MGKPKPRVNDSYGLYRNTAEINEAHDSKNSEIKWYHRVATWAVSIGGWAGIANLMYDGSNLLEAIVGGGIMCGWGGPVIEIMRLVPARPDERSANYHVTRDSGSYSSSRTYIPSESYSEEPAVYSGRRLSQGDKAAAVKHFQQQQQRIRQRRGF